MSKLIITKRCKVCGKVIRSHNQSGLCSYHARWNKEGKKKYG